MIQITLTNEMLQRITAIEEQRLMLDQTSLPLWTQNRLRKLSKKKSAHASTRIEGNPLSQAQAYDVIDQDEHKHFLKPEQEVRNYYLALQLLDEKCRQREPFSVDLLLEVQALVEKGASKEKIGLRGATPPGVLFAVYDSETGYPEYIPPEYVDIPMLLDELTDYVLHTDDHPLIIAAVVHYQLVTIHPFEDGNGRTARLMSGYILQYYGYGFQGIGSLEEYFAYDADEYYRALQMGLPALYYDGRHDPPHPELWVHYFLRMVELYASKARTLSEASGEEALLDALSHLGTKEKQLLALLLERRMCECTPAEVNRLLDVTSKTSIARLAKLTQNGFIVPVLAKERIRTYRFSEYTKDHAKELLSILLSSK